MAITFVKEVGEAQSKVSTHTSLAVTVPAGGVALDNLLVVAIAMNDDAGTVSIADTGLNSYTLVPLKTHADGDENNAGHARCLIFLCKVTTALVSGNTITITHPATVASACVIGEFTGVAKTVNWVNVSSLVASTSIQASNFTVRTGNTITLFAVAAETPNEAFGIVQNLDAIVGDLGTTGGGAASNILAGLAYKINIAAGVNVELSQSAARDYRAIVVTLFEEVSPTISQPELADCTNDASIGSVAWSNPSQAFTSDNNRTTVTLLVTQTTNYLKCLDYLFDIPAGNDITGIQVDVEGHESAIAANVISARLVIGGTIQTGHTKTVALPDGSGAEAYLSMGGSSDLWGQSSISIAQVEAADFGVALYIENALANTINIDHVRIQVYYTPTPTQFDLGYGTPFGQRGESFMQQILRR